jgi:catechol 2,3-dioxygenase
MHFEDITLIVKHLETSIDFYHDILGFKYQIKDRKAILFADHKPLVILIEDPSTQKTKDVFGLYHVAFLLPSKAALAGIINQLIKHHYPTSGLTDHGVSVAIYLNDPDGNGQEITEK